jgi:multidrug transporter EmrE-like cation transporter
MTQAMIPARNTIFHAETDSSPVIIAHVTVRAAPTPTHTAYAVWVGVGAVLTVLVAVLRGEERLGVARALLLVALIGCVAGLKVVS